MEALISIMNEVLNELKDINSKLDDIRGTGSISLDDICDKLTDIHLDTSSIDSSI